MPSRSQRFCALSLSLIGVLAFVACGDSPGRPTGPDPIPGSSLPPPVAAARRRPRAVHVDRHRDALHGRVHRRDRAARVCRAGRPGGSPAARHAHRRRFPAGKRRVLRRGHGSRRAPLLREAGLPLGLRHSGDGRTTDRRHHPGDVRNHHRDRHARRHLRKGARSGQRSRRDSSFAAAAPFRAVFVVSSDEFVLHRPFRSGARAEIGKWSIISGSRSMGDPT
jgi:hypothetical protein